MSTPYIPSPKPKTICPPLFVFVYPLSQTKTYFPSLSVCTSSSRKLPSFRADAAAEAALAVAASASDDACLAAFRAAAALATASLAESFAASTSCPSSPRSVDSARCADRDLAVDRKEERWPREKTKHYRTVVMVVVVMTGRTGRKVAVAIARRCGRDGIGSRVVIVFLSCFGVVYYCLPTQYCHHNESYCRRHSSVEAVVE